MDPNLFGLVNHNFCFQPTKILDYFLGKRIPEDAIQEKHIVIIGGGYAGIQLANQLMKDSIRFTLIDSKEFFHHKIAALRAAVQPDWIQQTFIGFKETFKNHFIQGRVEFEGFNDILRPSKPYLM